MNEYNESIIAEIQEQIEVTKYWMDNISKNEDQTDAMWMATIKYRDAIECIIEADRWIRKAQR